MRQVLIQKVAQTIAKNHLLKPGSKVLVALSGGADSVALLLVMQQLGYDLEALHCNFNLRGEESKRDEKFVTDLCAKRNITLHIRHFNTIQHVHTHKISIEMAARDLRYAWFEGMLQARKAKAICVAHHTQDQAETILLNLIRGTGIRGLAGMKYKNGNIVRPLLDSCREEIEAFLEHEGQEWVIDSTNNERDAQRNCIRLDIIPQLLEINPGAIRNIAKAAQHIQESIPIYEQGLKAGGNTPAFTSKTQLHEAIREYGFNETQEDNIWQARTGAIIESRTHLLLKDRNRFILKSRDEALHAPELIQSVVDRMQINEMQSDTLYLDNDKVCHPLHIRQVLPNDRISPLGMKGSKLVSDIMTDLKMNRFEKEEQYVLTDGNNKILWVIGKRASQHNIITTRTSKVLCISIKSYHTPHKRIIGYVAGKEN